MNKYNVLLIINYLLGWIWADAEKIGRREKYDLGSKTNE
jgi:hypothetical protein